MRHRLLGILALVIPAGLSAQQPHGPPTWSITMGAGTFVFPRYPGSDQYRVLPLPLIQVSYRERVFLGPSTTGVGFALGAYAIRTGRVDLAVEVGGQDGRPASRADALAGLEDRDGVGTVGVSLSYRAGALEGGLGALRGLNDGAGYVGTARLSLSRTRGRLMMTLSSSAALADARQMRREFGVTELEAGRRQALIVAGDTRLEPDEGIPYRPTGGLRHLGASVSLIYLISPRWSLMGFAGVERLGSQAAASPLVRRREQLWSGIGLGYRL